MREVQTITYEEKMTQEIMAENLQHENEVLKKQLAIVLDDLDTAYSLLGKRKRKIKRLKKQIKELNQMIVSMNRKIL